MKFFKMLIGTSLAFFARNAVAGSNEFCASDDCRNFPAQTEQVGSEELNLEILSQEMLAQESISQAELSHEMKDKLQNQMQGIVGNRNCIVEVLRPDVSSAVIKGGY